MQHHYRHLLLSFFLMGVFSPVWSCAQNIHPQIPRLTKAIKYYQQIAVANKWATIPENILLRPTDTSEYVLKLRHNLALTRDLTPPDTSTLLIYDKTLKAAVIKFQERHGLKPDGIVGQQTLQALNITPAQRIRQMEFNLLRWQADTVALGANRVLLNIPDFTLKLLDGNNNTVWQTRVMVGQSKTGKQTHLLRSRISYLVLNPTWNIPPSIIRDEIIPNLKKDHHYLARRNMILYRVKNEKKYPIAVRSVNWKTADPELDELMVIQSPGKENALGRIKFIFDNPYQIYLHDTPEKSFFDHDVRDFSHGCIRVQNPELLAAYLLNQDWQKKPQPLVISKSRSEKIVFLPKPMPLKIGYFTSWVNEQGLVQFRPDIYKLDNFGTDFKVLGME